MSDRREMAKGINILVLEGGGARGLSSLIILDQTMDRLQKTLSLPNPPSVRDHFDVVAGTGTGAVIACMVGRLGISVKKSIEHYTELVEVFMDRKWLGTTTCKMTKLQNVLKAIVRETTGDENTRMMDTSNKDHQCRTMVFAMSKYNMNATTPRIFRSYQAVANQMPDCAIWEAVSASMAHPEMFKPVDIGETYMRESFVDGGFGCNNPTVHALAESKTLFPGRHLSNIVCIGAGHPDTIQFPARSAITRFMPTKVLAVTQQIATDAERVAQEMATRFRSMPDVYFRFSVDQGMQQVGLSEWEKLSEVTAHTRAYMLRPEASATMDRAVRAIGEKKAAASMEQVDGQIQSLVTLPQLMDTKACPLPTPVFTGRQDQIDQIKACLVHGDKQRCVFVLHGLGGAGKTQLALKTIEGTWDMWTDIFFIDATSKQTLVSSLETFAKSRKVGQAYQDMLRALAGRRERWLMVFDNADDPSLQISDFLPGGKHGSIMITTRIPGMSLLARGPNPDFGVSMMSADEGLELLIKVAGMQKTALASEENIVAIKLLQSIGYLALGIVQAGAYIRSSQCTVSQYYGIFIAKRQETLERYTKLPVKVDSYEKSVYTTWYMSYQLLSPRAQQLLHLMAFMHHSGIVEDTFRRAASQPNNWIATPETDVQQEARVYVTECLQPYLDSHGAWDSGVFLATMTELLSYSLVSYNRGDGAYTFHVLVHDWAGTVIENPIDIALEHTALLLALSIDFNDTMESLAYKRAVEVHVSKLLEKQAKPSTNNAASFSEVFYRTGKWGQAEKLHLIEVEGRRQALGEDHDLTLTSLGNLAYTYVEQGRYQEAIALLSRTLNIRKRIPGEEHSAALMDMHNLGFAYYALGRYKDAESLHLQLVDTRKRLHGDEHPNTLTSMHELALAYQGQGRYDEAEALLLQVVDAKKRVSGDEHPETLASMNQLSYTYYYQGQYEQAESLQVLVLDASKRRLGEEHPHTLSSMSALALTYASQGRHSEAETLQVQLLHHKKRLYAADHPETLTEMHNLGLTYRKQGRYQKAEELHLQVVEKRKHVLGAKNPHTLKAMEHLLVTYSYIGTTREQEYEALRTQIEELETKPTEPLSSNE